MERVETTKMSMRCSSKDAELFVGIWNQGIDAHLEAFTESTFEERDGRIFFEFDGSEMHILIRRLEEYLEARDPGEDEADEEYLRAETWLFELQNIE